MTYLVPKNRKSAIIKVKDLEIDLNDHQKVREKLQKNKELLGDSFRIEINPS